MLINTQFHLSNLLGLSHGWTIAIYLIYTELLVWASYSDTNYLSEHPNSHTNYLSEHLHSDTGVILIVARSLPVTCIFLSDCLYGWSNSNVSIIYLTIRTISGNHR